MNTAWPQRFTLWTAGLSARERLALSGAAVLVGLSVLWGVGIAPAWRTLRDAPAQQARLTPQLHTMRALAAQARTLQNSQSSTPRREDNQRALVAATQRHLGATTAPQIQGDQATVVLQAVPASNLAAWLEDVRINAHMVPIDAQLNRASPAHWSGTIVLGGAGLSTP